MLCASFTPFTLCEISFRPFCNFTFLIEDRMADILICDKKYMCGNKFHSLFHYMIISPYFCRRNFNLTPKLNY